MYTRGSALLSKEINRIITDKNATLGAFLKKTPFSKIIENLFANNEQGFFYDPSDLTTLYQDSSGTVPVTGVGQPVGLVLDKSKGLALSSELKQSALAKTTGTAPVATFNPVTGVGTVNCVDISNQSFIAFNDAVGSKWYKVSITNSSAVPISLRNTSFGVDATLVTIQANATFNGYVYVPSGFLLGIAASTGECGFTVNSIKEIVGNHAYQATSASRPVLGRHPTSGLRNLAQFNNNPMDISWAAPGFTKTGGKLDSHGTYTAVEFKGKPTGVTTVAALASANDFITYTVCLKAGSLTSASIYLRNNTTEEGIAACSINLLTGVVTTANAHLVTAKSKPNGFWEVSITSSKEVAVGDKIAGYYGLTSILGFDENTSFTADYCQIEHGKRATNIQTTTTLFDTTEAGFDNVYYLSFDGADDFLQTSNIDFTATDKISLFAGVRKLRDAALGMLLEFSKTIAANTGVFYVTAPNAPGKPTYKLASKGSLEVNATTTPLYAAPVSSVIGVALNIGGDSAIMRVNGSQVTQSSADQGTGNFGNYPLYIGRRSGTTYPFNGHIYGLIGIGKLTTDTETTAIEKELAKRTGVTLDV